MGLSYKFFATETAHLNKLPVAVQDRALGIRDGDQFDVRRETALISRYGEVLSHPIKPFGGKNPCTDTELSMTAWYLSYRIVQDFWNASIFN
jgi:hypothetical protein